MARKDLTTREPVNCAVDKELNKKLIQLSKDTKIPKSKLLDEAIELLLQKRVLYPLYCTCSLVIFLVTFCFAK